MRILYLSLNLPPEPGATKRPLRQAYELTKLGHSVTILAGLPQYPYGRVFDGYRGRLFMREDKDGVRIVRLLCLPTRNQGLAWRTLSFASFCIHAVVASLFLSRPDVVLVSATPLIEAGGLAIARLRRARLVLELRDLMPEKLRFIGVSSDGLLARCLRRYFDFVYRRAAILALAENDMADALLARGIVEPALIPLPHAVDCSDLASKENIRTRLHLEGKLVLVYAGSFSSYYRLPTLLAVAERISGELPQAVFLLVGAGPDLEAMKKSIVERGIRNVILTGGVDPDTIPGYLHAADMFIHPQLLQSMTDGTKITEYLAAGRPIVNICHAGGSYGQAEALGIGRSVLPGDVPAFCTVLKHYAGHPLERAQAAQCARALVAERQLDRRAVVREFERRMRAVLSALNQ